MRKITFAYTAKIAQPAVKGETTKRGPQVRGPGPWTTLVDHSRGPVAKFSPSQTIGSSTIYCRYIFHNHFSLHWCAVKNCDEY